MKQKDGEGLAQNHPFILQKLRKPLCSKPCGTKKMPCSGITLARPPLLHLIVGKARAVSYPKTKAHDWDDSKREREGLTTFLLRWLGSLTPESILFIHKIKKRGEIMIPREIREASVRSIRSQVEAFRQRTSKKKK